MGSPLKISRPHDYMPLEAVQSLLTPAAAAASASSPGVSSSAPVTVLKPSRYVALGNVVAPEELGVAEECSFVAEDTKAKFETEYGTVEHVFVVMSAKVQALALSSLAALLLTAVSFPALCRKAAAAWLRWWCQGLSATWSLRSTTCMQVHPTRLAAAACVRAGRERRRPSRVCVRGGVCCPHAVFRSCQGNDAHQRSCVWRQGCQGKVTCDV